MNVKNKTVIVAADGGGTGCRAAVGTLQEGVLAQASGGPGNVHSNFDAALENLTTAIRTALAQAGLQDVPTDQITAHLGVAGAHSPVEMARVRNALPYGASSVTGDRETSVRGVLGDVDGYVIALGTGTIVARQSNLKMQTVGGWGFDLSDQASGAWLGKRLLEETIMAEDGLQPHSDLSRNVLVKKGGLIATVHFSGSAVPGEYAKLARDVITMAKAGDPLGIALMREGADYLARGLTALGYQSGDTLSLAGGVGPHYANYLPDDMTRALRPPQGTALEGAFAMACQAARARR